MYMLPHFLVQWLDEAAQDLHDRLEVAGFVARVINVVPQDARVVLRVALMLETAIMSDSCLAQNVSGEQLHEHVSRFCLSYSTAVSCEACYMYPGP